MQERVDGWFREVLKAGVPVDELSSEIMDHVRHEVEKSDSLLGAMGQMVRKLGRGRKESFQMRRAIRDKGVYEANELRRIKSLPDLFTSDPVKYDTMLKLSHNRAMGNALFLQELINQHGVRLASDAPIPPGYEVVSGLKSKFLRHLGDVALDSEAVDFLRRYDKVWSQPGPWLEGWMLVSPAFHVRNFGSNIWLSAARDGANTGSWTHGFRARLNVPRGTNAEKIIRVAGDTVANPSTGKPLTYGEVYQFAKDGNLLGYQKRPGRSSRGKRSSPAHGPG